MSGLERGAGFHVLTLRDRRWGARHQRSQEVPKLPALASGVSELEKSSGVLHGPITSGLSFRAVLKMTWSPMRHRLCLGFYTSIAKVSVYSFSGWNVCSRAWASLGLSLYSNVMSYGSPSRLLDTGRKSGSWAQGKGTARRRMGRTLMASLCVHRVFCQLSTAEEWPPL